MRAPVLLRHGTRAIGLVTVLLAVVVPLLAACAAAPGEAVPPPAEEPAPPIAGDPDPDGNDAGDGGVVVPEEPGHDWNDAAAEAALPGGWSVRDCDGDAPLRCLHDPAGELAGVVEFLRFPEHDGLAGDPAADLARLVADFETWLRADRAVGCPDHVVTTDPVLATTVAGAAAVLRGHTMHDPHDNPVEAGLAAYIADGPDLVIVNVPATAPGSCVHDDELVELAPEELAGLRDALVALIEAGTVPAA